MTDPRDRNEAIEPATFSLSLGSEPGGAGSRRRALRLVALVAVLAALIFGLFVVVVMLPQWVGTPDPRTAPVAATSVAAPDADAAEPGAQSEADPAPPRASASEPADRKDTQALLRDALEKLEALERLHADSWAKSEIHAIRGSIAEGEKAYREKRYNAARNLYLDSAERIERLTAKVPDYLEKLLDSAFLALDNGDSAAAANAFEQVLNIEPDNERAARGRARARTLDQVLALVGQAEGYERLGQTDQALAAYRKALDLDGEAPGASAAIARIQRQRRASAFRTAMTDGLQALERNDFDTARAALERAAKIDSNAPEAQDALKQLANAETTYRINGALAGATAAAKAERWAEAAKHYETALKLDPRLTRAIEGKRMADRLHGLQVKLTAYVSRPERLGTQTVRDEAERVLEDAKRVSDPGPGLARHIAELDRALTLARTPVTVAFRSNNATTVTIYTVGELGVFELRELSLLPGEYTAVGRRDGYRDVRVEFSIEPGSEGRLVTVQCEEKFAFGS